MRVCLNMIVKNEAHVIARCLRSVRPYIHAWAVADTGSTDGTQEIVREMLAGLPGELIERPWVDFAHNRNEALDLAGKYGDYALMIDADDVLDVDESFQKRTFDAPGYLIEMVYGDSLSWWRVALVRLGLDWQWQGAIHETLHSESASAIEGSKLVGARIRVVGGGARSLQPEEQRLARDIETLRRALADSPDDRRYAFHLAQALRDSGRLSEAMDTYRRRIEISEWPEEVYYAKFQIGVLKERLGAEHAEILAAYMDAYDCRPQCAEAPYRLARYLRCKQHYASALLFARIASGIERPQDVLPSDPSVYQWRARDEFAMASFLVGAYGDCVRLCGELLASPQLPLAERERVRSNQEAAMQTMRSMG